MARPLRREIRAMNEEDVKTVVDQVSNALQSALLLAERVRRNAGDQADDALRLEGSIDRAARAISKLKPENGQ
jgi:hypothetical protein